MTGPVISVCMVTYNQESLISQAIESVLMQKGEFQLRLLISDDGSTDNTAVICQEYAKKYPQHIVFHRNEKNLGPHLNFYNLMKKVSGEYIAFCEGDDYWTDTQKLQKQIRFLEENREFNICAHTTKIMFSDGRCVDDFITKEPPEVTTLDDLIARGNYMHTPSVVLRNNFTLSDWYINCPVGDYPLYILALKDGKIKYFKEPMAVYRLGGRFSQLSETTRRALFLKTLSELIAYCPDQDTKNKLIKKQRNIFIVYVLMFPFWGKWNLKELQLTSALMMNKKL